MHNKTDMDRKITGIIEDRVFNFTVSQAVWRLRDKFDTEVEIPLKDIIRWGVVSFIEDELEDSDYRAIKIRMSTK